MFRHRKFSLKGLLEVVMVACSVVGVILILASLALYGDQAKPPEMFAVGALLLIPAIVMAFGVVSVAAAKTAFNKIFPRKWD